MKTAFSKEVISKYKGIEIAKTWFSSNFTGTVTHSAILPDGSHISSPDRRNLKKRINKFLNVKL